MSLYKTPGDQIAKQEPLTDRISIGITKDGKIMTIIDGKPFVQCRGAVIVLESEGQVEGRLSEYRNMDEFLEGRIEEERDLDAAVSGRHAGAITPEEEMMVHKSNLEAWIENGYGIDIIDSRIAFPILSELARTDKSFERKLFFEVERRWIEGNDNSRLALVGSSDLAKKMAAEVEASLCKTTGEIHEPSIAVLHLGKGSASEEKAILGCISRYFKARLGSDWFDLESKRSLERISTTLPYSMQYYIDAIRSFDSGFFTEGDVQVIVHASSMLKREALAKFVSKLHGSKRTFGYVLDLAKKTTERRMAEAIYNLADLDVLKQLAKNPLGPPDIRRRARKAVGMEK